MREMIVSGEATSVDDLVKSTGIDRKQVRLTMRLAFLAPDIQQSIFQGRHPVTQSLELLTDKELPVGWNVQRRVLGT